MLRRRARAGANYHSHVTVARIEKRIASPPLKRSFGSTALHTVAPKANRELPELGDAFSVRLGTLLTSIRTTALFKRLDRVAFLGVIDYAQYPTLPMRQRYSRAQHSEGVLGIGLQVTKYAHLDPVDVLHLAATCLVHDLGHPPFSHSFEYAFPKRIGQWTHHAVLNQILTKPAGQDREVVRALVSSGVSPDRVFSIVNGSDPLSYFFVAPVNIDTIDGITRSMWSLGVRPDYNTNDLVRLAAIAYDGEQTIDDDLRKSADAFWRRKADFYRLLETRTPLAATEAAFQEAVRRNVHSLTREHFRLDDKQLSTRYPSLLLESATRPAVEAIRPRQEFVIDDSIRALDKITLPRRYQRRRNAPVLNRVDAS